MDICVRRLEDDDDTPEEDKRAMKTTGEMAAVRDGGSDGGSERKNWRYGGGEPLPKPDGYAQMTKTQQRHWRKNRAKKNH